MNIANSRTVKNAALGLLAVVWLTVFACRLLTIGLPPWEEIRYAGMLTTARADGLRLPLTAYLHPSSYSDGWLSYGVLLTPLYWLFGSRYLWIVLLGSSFAVVGLAAWAWVLRRVWGFSCAALFLLLCIGPPVFFEDWSHHAFWGKHIETIFFSGMAVLLLFHRWRNPPGFWRAALWAAFAAWSAEFSIENLPLVATLAVMLVWRHGRRGLYRLAWPAAPLFLLLGGKHLYDAPTASPLGGSPAAYIERVVGKTCGLFAGAFPAFLQYSHSRVSWLDNLDPHNAGVAALSASFYAIALAGLALAALAALFSNSRGWVKFFGPAATSADSPANAGEQPEQSVWLARFVAAHFAVWVGAYAVFSIDIKVPPPGFRPDDCRYMFPTYPLLLAAVCYALAYLPGAFKWLAAAPFVVVGFGQLCGSLNFGLPPAETWRELNAERGDDYAYFISNVRARDCWSEPGGPEAAVLALPRRWRDFAWIAFGARMPADRAEQWRRRPDDPAVPAARRALIAKGRGKTIGRKLCCTGDFPADDFPATVMEPATATALFSGIGYGCFQMACGDCDHHAIFFTGAYLLPQAGQEYAPELTCRAVATGEALRLAEQKTGLSPRDGWQAFLSGLAMYIGAMNDPVDAARRAGICRIWASVFSVDAGDECPESFNRGLAEGQAIVAMNYFREVTLRPDPEKAQTGFRGSPADWPPVREALGRWGVDASPVDRIGRRFRLRIAP